MSINQDQKSRRVFSSGIAERGIQPRRFASLLTGGAVAFALVLGAAMPAKAAKNDDLAKALIAALVVGAIVKGLDDAGQDRRDVRPEKVRGGRVPSVCAISIDGAKQSVTLYSETCLKGEGVTAPLPKSCANTATIFGRKDRVYSAQCLRNAGFRVSGR